MKCFLCSKLFYSISVHVRLVVARTIQAQTSGGGGSGVPQFDVEPGSAIVPMRVLIEPAERYLISTGYPEIFGESSTASTPQPRTSVSFIAVVATTTY